MDKYMFVYRTKGRSRQEPT